MTILIKNAKILGSNLNSQKNFDVFISKDKISGIGNFVYKNAAKTIDAKGSYLSYGFIDAYNELDHNLSLLDKTKEANLIQNGIIGLICGHDGFSLAPHFYPHIYKLKYYTNIYKKNLSWQTTSEFLKFFKKNYDLNIFTFVGFDSLKYIISGKEIHKPLGNKEFLVFLNLLNRSLKEGALGLSLDLDDVFTNKISWQQIKEISIQLNSLNKIFSISLPLLEINEFKKTIEKLLNLSLNTNVKLLLSNYLNIYLTSKENIEIFKQIEDLYPKVFIAAPPYPLESMFFYKLLPFWFTNKNFEEILENINDEWFYKRILNEIREISDKFMIVETSLNFKNPKLKTIRDLMSFYGVINRKKALLEFARLHKLRSLIFEENILPDVFIDLILSKFSLIGSYGLNFVNDFSNSFLEFIKFSLNYQLMNLEKTFQKITILPSQFFNFKNFGEIKINNYANLVGFNLKNNEIQIKFVILNGKVIFENND
jgi:hypothetical protein